MRQAREAMTHGPMGLTLDHRMYHALDLMERHRIRHIPICTEEGEWVGMISDRDIKRHSSPAFRTGKESSKDRVGMTRRLGEIMSRELVYVSPSSAIAEVIALMEQRKIGSVLVREEGSQEVLGIITQTDLLRYLRELLSGR